MAMMMLCFYHYEYCAERESNASPFLTESLSGSLLSSPSFLSQKNTAHGCVRRALEAHSFVSQRDHIAAIQMQINKKNPEGYTP